MTEYDPISFNGIDNIYKQHQIQINVMSDLNLRRLEALVSTRELDAGFAGGALVREVRPSPRHSPQYAK
jgi:hypothetical protein